MNLRTNVRIKIINRKGTEITSVKWFTIRFSELSKRFLFERIKNYLEKIKFDKNKSCELIVYYTRKIGEENRGTYTNIKDLLHAFYCFTEQSLIKDFWDKVLIPRKRVTWSTTRKEKMMEGLKRYKEALSK